MMTQSDLEAGVKGQIRHLLKIARHDFLWVSFTFSSHKNHNKEDTRPFCMMTPHDLEAEIKGHI